MPTKEEIVTSVAKMLNERYDSDHNVTIQSVVEKYLLETYHFKRHLRRTTAVKLCDYLEKIGIFRQYMINDEPIKRTWTINFEVLLQFIEKED